MILFCPSVCTRVSKLFQIVSVFVESVDLFLQIIVK